MISRRSLFGIPFALPFLSLPAKAAPKPRDEKIVKMIDAVSENAKDLRAAFDGTSTDKFTRLYVRARANVLNIRSQALNDHIRKQYPWPAPVTTDAERERLRDIGADLREQMTSIIGFSALMLDETIPREKRDEYAKQVFESAGAMNSSLHRMLIELSGQPA